MATSCLHAISGCGLDKHEGLTASIITSFTLRGYMMQNQIATTTDGMKTRSRHTVDLSNVV